MDIHLQICLQINLHIARQINLQIHLRTHLQIHQQIHLQIYQQIHQQIYRQKYLQISPDISAGESADTDHFLMDLSVLWLKGRGAGDQTRCSGRSELQRAERPDASEASQSSRKRAVVDLKLTHDTLKTAQIAN